MNAKVAVIKSKVYTAKSNVAKVVAAEKHAINSGLEDSGFLAMTTRIRGLVERSTMKSSHVRDGLTNSSGPDLLQFVPIAEEYADKALKESEKALKIMQVAVTAATERKRAREGAASNNPGGSNA